MALLPSPLCSLQINLSIIIIIRVFFFWLLVGSWLFNLLVQFSFSFSLNKIYMYTLL